MKIVAETKPFGSDKNGIDDDEEGVEICVPDRGDKHNRNGEVEVERKDAVLGGFVRNR